MPIVHAIITLTEVVSGKVPLETGLKEASSIPDGPHDPELYAIFLLTWAFVSAHSRRFSEASALIQRARGTFSDDTPPEIKCLAIAREGYIAAVTGNVARREELQKEDLKTLPPDSPHRRHTVLDYAQFLCQQGRGTEVEDELQWLASKCDDTFKRSRVAYARFYNSVETGRVGDADLHLEEINSDPEWLASQLRIRIGIKVEHAFLEHVRAALRMKPADTVPRGEPIPPGKHDELLHDAESVIRCLTERRTAEALEWARKCELNADFYLGTGFVFNLVRAEIAAGNIEAARSLIEKRQRKGWTHYLDDLYFARIEFLAGNRDAAATRFAGALRSVERYGAHGRFDFELSLACELTPLKLIELARAAERAHQATKAQPKPDTGKVEAKPTAPASVHANTGIERLVGVSPQMTAVREAVVRYAPLMAPVLIMGETGTGKELVARALHEASPRASQPFLALNCGAISESLLESELFGHERGSFSGAVKAHLGLFEDAGQGTLFLDEIGEISPRLQVALLRVLESGEIRPVGSTQTRKIRCRIVAASNIDFDKAMETGSFRKDLVFRLRRLEIRIPPLRERPVDIIPLASHFLNEGRQLGHHAIISAQLSKVLTQYPWSGNARELKNELERMRLMNSDKLFYDLADLREQYRVEPAPEPQTNEAETATPNGHAEPASNGGGSKDVLTLLRSGRSRLRRLDGLRDLFREHKKLTRTEAMTILGISANTATQDLKILCDEGYIQRVQPSASSRSDYFVLMERKTR